jgi:hypothetical protein
MTQVSTHAEFVAELARERRHAVLVGREFTEACRTGNVRDFYRCVDRLGNETVDGWRLAMKGVGRLPSVSPRIRRAFLPVWIEHKGLPRSVGHRPTMAAALRVLMAGSYQGPALTLFRGTIESESRRRLIGFSWSIDQQTATTFAQQHASVNEALKGNPMFDLARRRAVILSTIAPPESILLRREREGYFDEDEVVVDPYRLGRVSIVRL